MTRLFSGLFMAATVLTAAPALAQDQGFSVSFGYFSPTGTDGRVAGDVLNSDRCIDVSFQCEPLLFETRDFGAGTVNGEYILGLGRYFEASVGVGFYQRTVPSIYENVTFPDDSEIQQDLKLRVIPITGIVRFIPTGRRAPIQPYVGIGIAALRWHYAETGDFVDTNDNSIFPARYVDDGTQVAPIYLGGLRAPLGDSFMLGGEVRFQNADAPLNPDAELLGDRLDLGGTSFLGTLTWKFGR